MSSYRFKAPVYLALKDQHGKGREDDGTSACNRTHLPRQLLFSSPRVHPSHYPDNIERRRDVEDLEAQVPEVAFSENVNVAGTENDGVEHLCDERDS